MLILSMYMVLQWSTNQLEELHVGSDGQEYATEASTQDKLLKLVRCTPGAGCD